MLVLVEFNQLPLQAHSAFDNPQPWLCDHSFKAYINGVRFCITQKLVKRHIEIFFIGIKIASHNLPAGFCLCIYSLRRWHLLQQTISKLNFQSFLTVEPKPRAAHTADSKYG